MNLHDEICKLAYELYERSGRCEGRDAENWLEAERIVMARYAVVAQEAAPKTKKAPAKTATKKTQAVKAEPKATKTKAAPKAKKAPKTE
jgi:hypothetical protein